MDRKGIIAVTVSVLILLIWQIEFAPKFTPPVPPPVPPPGQTPAGTSPAPSKSISGATGEASPGAIAAPAMVAMSGTTAPEPKVPEKITDVGWVQATYHFTNHGGGISRAELAGYSAESGSSVDLNEFGTYPIGAVSETPDEGADLAYTVTTEADGVLCVRNQPGGLTISKKFTLPASKRDASGYRIKLDITFANSGAEALQSPGYYLYAGSATPIHQTDQPLYTTFDWYSGGGKMTQINVSWFAASTWPLVGIERTPERPVYTVDADKIGWAAINSQFFTTIVAPKDGAAGNGVWAHRFPVKTATRDVMAIEGALRMPAFSLPPGKSVTQSYEIYAGPKIYSTLKDLGDGQEAILNYGIYKFVAVSLLWAMTLLYHWTGSYAIAIILLTICVRGVLWPIQNRATASMRQMQELQPRMNELKEKYKDDTTRLNTEMMKLYKEYNINPLAGCLPMLIQMPIFFGFLSLLRSAIELRGSRFLWVHDLSQPDTIFHLAGFPINILPIFMALTTLVSMSLQPKTGDQAQQRMFLFMPLIFLCICYNFASALALYYTIGNLFSIAQLYVTRKKTAPAPFKAPVKRKTR